MILISIIVDFIKIFAFLKAVVLLSNL